MGFYATYTFNIDNKEIYIVARNIDEAKIKLNKILKGEN